MIDRGEAGLDALIEQVDRRPKKGFTYSLSSYASICQRKFLTVARKMGVLSVFRTRPRSPGELRNLQAALSSWCGRIFVGDIATAIVLAWTAPCDGG